MAAEILYPVKKLVPLTDEMAKRIAAYRFDERLPSENEAIRRLIEAGLKAESKDEPPAAEVAPGRAATSP